MMMKMLRLHLSRRSCGDFVASFFVCVCFELGCFGLFSRWFGLCVCLLYI